MIRVLILHEIYLIGNAMATVLGNEEDVHIAGLASTPDEAFTLLRTTPCHVLLVNAQHPSHEIINFVQRITQEIEDLKVLMVGVVEAEEFILQCFQAGAIGYAERDDSIEELIRRMRVAYEGKTLLSPEIACALVSRVAELSQCAVMDCMPDSNNLRLLCAELTPREREVLRHIEQGCTNQDIAEALTIEVGTVKNHVHNILRKLNVDNRKRAAILARQFLSIPEKHPEPSRHLWNSYSVYTASPVSDERVFIGVG
jgi:DNA-binding NarL/FixJ family response regulator